MVNPKSERDRELRTQRLRVITLLDKQFATVCDSHNRRDISSMNAALERMLASILSLLDPDVNDTKRANLLRLFADADIGAQPADIAVEDKSVYIRGDFDIDKLASSVVWLKPALVIEMVPQPQPQPQPTQEGNVS